MAGLKGAASAGGSIRLGIENGRECCLVEAGATDDRS